MQLENEQILEIPESEFLLLDSKLDELIDAVTETNLRLSEAIESQRRQSELLETILALRISRQRSVPTSSFPFSS